MNLRNLKNQWIVLKTFLVLLFIFSLIIESFYPYNVKANYDEEVIKTSLLSFFEEKYRIRTLPTTTEHDFEPIRQYFYDTSSNNIELNKLQLEYLHNQNKDLMLLGYSTDIVFLSVSLTFKDQIAYVELIENHDVEFAITPGIISELRDLHHRIKLVKINDNWKIVEDQYEDLIWKTLKNITIADMKQLVLNEKDEMLSLDQTENIKSNGTLGTYNRSGAVQYAQSHYNNPNPNFYNFENSGGDCTNFVSQALNIGGQIPQTISSPGINVGWYYVSQDQYANAWTYTPAFYDFVIKGHWWTNGPEGNITTIQNLDAGDLILFDLSGPYTYDHAVIVVDMVDMGNQQLFPLVAGRSPSVNNYPYTAFLPNNTFPIHIYGY